MSRNLFESNDPIPDEEDIKAVADGPHIMLPPLTEGYQYGLKKLPSGRTAVVVEGSLPPPSECEKYKSYGFRGDQTDDGIDYRAFEQ